MGFGEDLEKILMRLNYASRQNCEIVADVIKEPIQIAQGAISYYIEAMSAYSPEDAYIAGEYTSVIEAEMDKPKVSNDRMYNRSIVEMMSAIDTLNDNYSAAKMFLKDKLDAILPYELIREFERDLATIKNLMEQHHWPSDVNKYFNKISTKWLIRYCDVYRRCAELMDTSTENLHEAMKREFEKPGPFRDYVMGISNKTGIPPEKILNGPAAREYYKWLKGLKHGEGKQ